MKTNNVFEYQQTPVSILNDKGDAVIVIDNKDKVFSVAKSDLKPSRLVAGGVYSDKFIQTVLGGLIRPSSYLDRNQKLYEGIYGSVIVEPVSSSQLKLAAGIPFKDLPISMRPDHTGKGKIRRYRNGMPSTLDNPVGPSVKNKPLTVTDDKDVLYIGAGDKEDIIKGLTLVWTSPINDIDVDAIRSLFGEGKILPEPDRIKIQRGEQIETYQKEAVDNSHVKHAYYGPTPIMTRSCPKCSSMLMIVTEQNNQSNLSPRNSDKVYLKCVVCGYESLYEGSLPGQGVAGQTDHE